MFWLMSFDFLSNIWRGFMGNNTFHKLIWSRGKSHCPFQKSREKGAQKSGGFLFWQNLAKNAAAKKKLLMLGSREVLQSADFLAEQINCASSSSLQRYVGITDHDRFFVTRGAGGQAVAGKDCSCCQMSLSREKNSSCGLSSNCPPDPGTNLSWIPVI